MPTLNHDKMRPNRLLQSEYGQYYKLYDADSHPQQRKHLIEEICNLVTTTKERRLSPLRILDIGSGAQLLEKELFQKHPELKQEIIIVTLDIVSINPSRLHFPHVQSDAAFLPFQDRYFDLVVSNMALDFVAPKEDTGRRNHLFEEIGRVTKFDGRLIANLHHPNLEIDYYTYQKARTEAATSISKLRKQLSKANGHAQEQIEREILSMQVAINDARFRYWEISRHVFADLDEIREFVANFPFFKIIKIEEQQSDSEKWFHLILEKKNDKIK
ncbi:MAG: methyltransferase domain-containing protein [bacterium]|nr:methyltransferase domain-containing protein [bacterium]